MSLGELENTDNSWEKLRIVGDKPTSNAKGRKLKQRERNRWNEMQTKLTKVLRRFVRRRCEEIDGKPKRFKKWVL